MDPENETLIDNTNADGEGNPSGAPTLEEPKQRELTPRELAMEAIQVNRSEDGITHPEPDDNAAGAADQLAAQLDAPRVLTDDLDKVMVKTKVDGVESEVSVAEMQRQYQKGKAADLRLEEATRLLREAKAATVTPPVGIGSSTPAEDDPGTKKPDAGIDGQKEFVSALFEGDEEKALAALAKLGIGRSDGPTQIDPQQLLTQLTPAVKQQLAEEVALDTFSKTYADIVKDPYLAQMADGFLEAEMKGGKSFTEALEASGTRTRDWLRSKGVPAPAPVPPEPSPTDVRASKLERKAQMDNIPALNTAASSTVEPQATASQTIAEMQKARGLY